MLRLRQGALRVRRTEAIVVGLLALPLMGWGTWVAIADHAAGDVRAEWSVERCTDTKVENRRTPEITMHPGWRCEIELRVTNEGERAVRVTGVESTALGSRGRAEIQALPSEDATVGDAGRSEGYDAVFGVDLAVPSQATRAVRLAVGWRPDGCTDGVVLTLPSWPTVVFESLGRTHRHQPDQRLVLRGLERGGCA